MEKLNRAQKCSILEPQNLGSRGARAPAPPWIRTCSVLYLFTNSVNSNSAQVHTAMCCPFEADLH